MKKKKRIFKNLSSWKTTLLGTAVVVAALVSKFKFPEHVSWWPDTTIAICLGVTLWMAPDTIINLIQTFFSKASGNVQPTFPLNGGVSDDGGEEMKEPGN